MKTLTTTLTTLALLLVATSGYAASPNGPKPRCTNMGEIPVVENGHWVCKAPSIKAKGNAMEAATAGGNNKLAGKKPGRAMPDYVITKVARTSGNDKMLAVTVKNNGAAHPVAGSELFATVMGGDIGTAGIAMPALKAGESQTTFISFFKAPDRGARIRVMADGNKKIKESNENNNVKMFVY